MLACCIGAVAGPEPTLHVQVHIDSLSDVNLLPSQWLVVLRGEGIEPTPLSEPLHLQWGIGKAAVVCTQQVELSTRVIGWAGQEKPEAISFCVIDGDGDSLTMGWATMRVLGITAELETLVAAQRTLGLTSACPSPRGDPIVHDFNGREASVAERDLGESDRERLVKEAQVCNVNRDPDYVDPAKVSPT